MLRWYAVILALDHEMTISTILVAWAASRFQAAAGADGLVAKDYDCCCELSIV
jgi:hypothetical protein